jgi:hypothetical protein
MVVQQLPSNVTQDEEITETELKAINAIQDK